LELWAPHNQEKLLLDRLSIFAGGWSFEAAESVRTGDGIDKREVLDLLGRLVDKSLVLAEHNEDGTTRYRLLEIVRQYAPERLCEHDGLDQTAQRHAAYFLDLVGSEARVLSPERKAWLDLFEQELDNFRAALQWFVSQRDGVRAQTVAAGLYRVWMYRGYASEGRLRLAESLTVSGGSRASRARACLCLGGVAFIQADHAAAQRDLSDSLSLWREVGDRTGMAWSLMGLGATATCCADSKRGPWSSRICTTGQPSECVGSFEQDDERKVS
jgi:hypothetical protein